MIDRLKQWYADEREKLTGLPRQDRIRYIWDYYKLYLIALAALLLIGGTTAWHLATTPAENWFFACFANTTANLGEGSGFYEGFAGYAGYDLREKNLLFEDQIFCQPSDETVGNTYYELLVAYLDAGTMDVVLMGEEDLVALGETGRLLDLRDERTAALCEAYAGRLVYCTSAEGEEIPVGIDLSDTALAGTAYGGDCVLGVSANVPHPDQVPVFLSYLLEEGAS